MLPLDDFTAYLNTTMIRILTFYRQRHKTIKPLKYLFAFILGRNEAFQAEIVVPSPSKYRKPQNKTSQTNFPVVSWDGSSCSAVCLRIGVLGSHRLHSLTFVSWEDLDQYGGNPSPNPVPLVSALLGSIWTGPPGWNSFPFRCGPCWRAHLLCTRVGLLNKRVM